MNDLQKCKAAVYLRVSTDEQAKEGYGLVYQEDKVRAFIKSQDYILDEKNVYRDEGYSGTYSSEMRPGLKQLMEDASKKEFDVVLVYKLDRLFRKTLYLIQAVEKLGLYGVGFRSISETFNTTDSTGKFVMTMFGALAEMERDTIRERTMNGRTAAAKSGKWAVGLPPYGYRVNKKTKMLYVVKEEAEIVRKFYEWIVYERMSLKRVAVKINGMGVDSPKHIFINRRKTYNHWYERTIGRILTNEIYTGVTYFRKYKRPFKNLSSVTSEELKRPKEDWIRITVPPIISMELYDAAIKQLQENKNNAQRNTKRLYLYSKLVYCGDCGFQLMSGYKKSTKDESDQAGTRYYHGAYRKPDAVGTTKRCAHCDQYAETRLEPIWNCLKEILQSPKNLRRPLEKYKFKGMDKETVKKQINEHNQRIQAIEVKEQKLTFLFLENNSMDRKQFDSLSGQFRKDKERHRTDILKLGQSIVKKGDEREREKVMHGLYVEIKAKLQNVSYENKRHILHLFIARINLHQKRNTAEVIFKFPVQEIATEHKDQVSKNSVRLILDVKTTSERELRQQLLMSNPLIYRGSKQYENIR